jgi:hypothetical protein
MPTIRRFAVTQAPHYSFSNGGETANARAIFMRPTQLQVHGPRIEAAIAGIAPGEMRPVYLSEEDRIFRVQRSDTGAWMHTLDWTPFFVFHQGTRQLIGGGRRRNLKFIAYSDVLGRQREMPMPPELGKLTAGTVHYYGYITQSPTGRIFVGAGVMLPYELNAATGAFTPLPPPPTTNGSNGGSYSWCTDTARLAAYAGDAQRWMTLNPGVDSAWTTHASGVGNGMHAIVCYHPMHARHLIVGGTGTSRRATLITSDGVHVQATDCPADIRMAVGSWATAHPAGCWLIKTMNEPTPGTFVSQLWAAWPNEALTDLSYILLGAAPDAGLTYPAIANYSETVRLIVGTNGIHAYALPNFSSDTTPPNITATGAGEDNGPFAASVDESSTTPFLTLTADEAVSWSPLFGADAALFETAGATAMTVQVRPRAGLTIAALSSNPTALLIAATDGSGNPRSVTINVSVEAGAPGAPTMPGSVTFTSVTTTGAVANWPAGSDAVGVVGYEFQVAGGPWTAAGLSLSAPVSGLSPATSYPVNARCFNAAGLRSNSISGTLTTAGVATFTATVGPFGANTGTGQRPAGTVFEALVFPPGYVIGDAAPPPPTRVTGTLNGSGLAVLSGLPAAGTGEVWFMFPDDPQPAKRDRGTARGIYTAV